MSNRRSAAFIPQEAIDAAYLYTVRWSSLVVLGVSFIAAMVALGGRWPTPLYDLPQLGGVAILGGLALQGFCTLSEWANRDNRLSPRYLAPFALDMGSTYVAFAPILVPIFTSALLRASLPTTIATIGAHLGVALVAAWFAYYPEVTLLKERSYGRPERPR